MVIKSNMKIDRNVSRNTQKSIKVEPNPETRSSKFSN